MRRELSGKFWPKASTEQRLASMRTSRLPDHHAVPGWLTDHPKADWYAHEQAIRQQQEQLIQRRLAKAHAA